MFRALLYKGFGVLGAGEAEKLELASKNPAACQQEKLLALLDANKDTIYGKEHKFDSIKSVSDFQNFVPINEYENLQPYIDRIADGEANILTREMPFMFATTSGTTGARKLIPITRAYVKEFRAASVSSGYHLLKNFPGVAKGVSLSVFSPAEEGKTDGQIPYGAISGRLYLEEPPMIKKFVSPLPYELFLISDYESRYYALLRCALMLPVSTIYTLNPSTIMVLARRLHTYADRLIDDIENGTLRAPQPLPQVVMQSVRNFLVPQPGRAKKLRKLFQAQQFKPTDVWPSLALICCWTRAAAAFYLQDFPEYFPGVPVCDITYGASEGRGTVSISPSEQMLAIRSHFFEFIPVNSVTNVRDADARPLLCHELKTGDSYYILFTTAGGLYRYNINDIVKVVGWHNATPLLEFQHKGGNISSFTGEKLTESQVTTAVRNAASDCAIRIRFFSVIPQFRPEPHYQLWFEPESECSDDQLQALNQHFDRHLRLCNIEYEAKRASNRLADTQTTPLQMGTYDELRKHLVSNGVPDAQVKISHLNPKEDVLEFMRKSLKSEPVASTSSF